MKTSEKLAESALNLFFKWNLEWSYEVTQFQLPLQYAVRHRETKYKADIIGMYSVLTAM